MIMIRNVSWAPDQHIRMISDRSCDIENRQIISFVIYEINYILKYIKNIVIILQFLIHFDQINVASASIRDFFPKHETNLSESKHLNQCSVHRFKLYLI